MKSIAIIFSLLAFTVANGQSTLNLSGQVANAPDEPIAVAITVFDINYPDIIPEFEIMTEAGGTIPPTTITLDDPWIQFSAGIDNCNPDGQNYSLIFEDSYEGPVYDIVIALDYCSNLYGCTDPVASNYNPEATADDGSCIYDGCDYNEISLSFDGNLNVVDTTFLYWNLSHYNGEVIQSGNYTTDSDPANICLLDGCYELNFVANHPDFVGSYSVMMNGAVLFSDDIQGSSEYVQITLTSAQLGCDPNEVVFGCTDPEAENYDPTATLDDGSCTYFEDIYGCMDPEALNYNPDATADDGSCEYPDPIPGCTDIDAFNYDPEATEDDGSCIYNIECSISFTALADSLGNLIMYIFPDENINNAESVIWDFGDGNTSNSLSPIHNYPTDGPYTLCITAFFPDGNGGLCETSFCMELTSDMINPPGMNSAGFTINVVPPGGTTDVHETLSHSSVLIWPNPTNSDIHVQVQAHQTGELNFNLFDLTGQLILQHVHSMVRGENQISISTNQLPAGIYLLQVSDDRDAHTHRIVID